ncbi:ribonuclease H-like protein, partial [Panus rudis PR-1116 ss-1]
GPPTARAGAGVIWGRTDRRNLSLRVPGAQTNNRGELYAILHAIHATPPQKSLHIVSDSLYAIDALCGRVASLKRAGWKCVNGDLIRNIVDLLEARPARTAFQWIKGHCGHEYHDLADDTARKGAAI